jgi:hypothetical protein
MPECGAPTVSGRPCRRAVAEGRCHQHRAHEPVAPPPEPVAPAPPPPPQPCGRWCTYRGIVQACPRPRAAGQDACDFHRRVELRAAAARERHQAWLDDAPARAADDPELAGWRAVLARALEPAPARNRAAEARAARAARMGEVGRFA